MKWSFLSVGLLIFGIIGIFIVTFFNDVTVSNEQDYYTLKEAAEAAMYEAVDVAYYRLTGKIKISQEKFVENLTRRFTETSTFGQGNYDLIFYDISESPPKISVRVVDSTDSYNIFNTFSTEIGKTRINVVNEISGILEIYSEGETRDDIPSRTTYRPIDDSELDIIDDEKIEDIIEETEKELEEEEKKNPNSEKASRLKAKIKFLKYLESEYDGYATDGDNIYVTSDNLGKEEFEYLDPSTIPIDSEPNPPNPISLVDEIVDNSKTVEYLTGVRHYTNDIYAKYEKSTWFGFSHDTYEVKPKYKSYIVYNNEYFVSTELTDSSIIDSCLISDSDIVCNNVTFKKISSDALCCVGGYKNHKLISNSYYWIYRNYSNVNSYEYVYFQCQVVNDKVEYAKLSDIQSELKDVELNGTQIFTTTTSGPSFYWIPYNYDYYHYLIHYRVSGGAGSVVREQFYPIAVNIPLCND